MTPAELRALVERVSPTQAEVARRLGVHRYTLNKWVCGKLTVAHPTILRLALERLAQTDRIGLPERAIVPASRPPHSAAVYDEATVQRLLRLVRDFEDGTRRRYGPRVTLLRDGTPGVGDLMLVVRAHGPRFEPWPVKDAGRSGVWVVGVVRVV